MLKFPADRKVFVMGMEGIEAELDAVNIKRCGGTHPEDNKVLRANDYSSLVSEEAIDPIVGAVVCGFDMHMNYAKLCKAFKYLTREGAQGPVLAGETGGGCHFILTNDDKVVPAVGELWPGSIPLLRRCEQSLTAACRLWFSRYAIDRLDEARPDRYWQTTCTHARHGKVTL